MRLKRKTALLYNIICILCISVFCSAPIFAQKADTSATGIRSKRINKTPQIKASVPTYKPKYNFGYVQYSDVVSGAVSGVKTPVNSNTKPEKLLTVLKVYPNPVDDQINIILRLDRDSNLSVKILDLLGNEIVTLSNERIQAGEHTKNYSIPNRLNSGIYFLKIVSGSETIVKRISVL